VITRSLASLAESGDDGTGGHIQRTRYYVKALAQRLRHHPRFRHFLNENTIDLLFRLAPLHEVERVGVRDRILLELGRLDREKFEEMKKYTILGSNVILQAERTLMDDSFLHIAQDIVLGHHERWDGTGYPSGKKGDEIPIAGRLMAVADAYDVLVTGRKYHGPYTAEEAEAILISCRGTQFDPDVVDAFLEIKDQIREISSRYDERGTEVNLPEQDGRSA
jgi:putative two-component system response regulator